MESVTISSFHREQPDYQGIFAQYILNKNGRKNTSSSSDKVHSDWNPETYYDKSREKVDVPKIEDRTSVAADTLQELWDIYRECSEDNWDGYKASPITVSTYKEAKKLLLWIPSLYPLPEILPEPDGGIALEWYKEPNISFAVSVNGTGIIHYAGLFGENNEMHGKETFTASALKTILYSLMRIFPKFNKL